MGLCVTKPPTKDNDSGHNVDMAGGNVNLINTIESWDQKLEEARRDGKILPGLMEGLMNHAIRLYKSGKELRKTNCKLITVEIYKLYRRIYSTGTVIANFSATWCGPCKMITPLYCELSEKYPSLMFLVIDVDEMPDFSTSWDIKATPTFFFLRDGQQIDKLVGANRPELLKKITAIVDSMTLAN